MLKSAARATLPANALHMEMTLPVGGDARATSDLEQNPYREQVSALGSEPTTSTTFQVMQSIPLDLRYGSQFHH